MRDEVAEAIDMLRQADIDPRTINVPAIAEAEGRPLLEVTARLVRAHRIARTHDQEMGLG
jgi:hypothetical protein